MSNPSSADEILHSDSDASRDPSVNGGMQHAILTIPVQGTSSVPPKGSSNSPPKDNDDDFPSHLMCVFSFKPPVCSVTFNIIDSNGNLSS
jgi:hypothetical protein